MGGAVPLTIQEIFSLLPSFQPFSEWFDQAASQADAIDVLILVC